MDKLRELVDKLSLQNSDDLWYNKFKK
jgi:hypothetical protein